MPGSETRFKVSEMEVELDEIALICAGSMTNKKLVEKYLKRQLRSAKKSLVSKKMIQTALNLVKKMSQEDYDNTVINFRNRTFFSNQRWE
jgi:predicted NodU family carbamoyl transferase